MIKMLTSFPTQEDMEPDMEGRLDAPWILDISFCEQRDRLRWLGFWLACTINLWCWL